MSSEGKLKSPFGKRLREARQKVNVTQKKLGILAGIDELSSSARINQYEQDVHIPDYMTAKRLASALGVSVTYLYAEEDDLAELILLYGLAKKQIQVKAKKLLAGTA